MIKKNLILFAIVFIASCVAQPFTPFVPQGKKKTQTLPLILPPTQTTTGCDVSIAIPATASRNTSNQILLGVSGTKTSVQLSLTEGGANVNSTRPMTSSNQSIATVSNGLITAVAVGTADISLNCSPSTRISILVSSVQNNLVDEKTLIENGNIDKELTKNE